MEIIKFEHEEIFTICEIMRESIRSIQATSKEYTIFQKELNLNELVDLLTEAIISLSYASEKRPVCIIGRTRFAVRYALGLKQIHLDAIVKAYSILDEVSNFPIVEIEMKRIQDWRGYFNSPLDFYIKLK